jgi:hypothetical protein
VSVPWSLILEIDLKVIADYKSMSWRGDPDLLDVTVRDFKLPYKNMSSTLNWNLLWMCFTLLAETLRLMHTAFEDGSDIIILRQQCIYVIELDPSITKRYLETVLPAIMFVSLLMFLH